MYYIIYKVTNKTNGKYYIGKHQTALLTDSYMGSGKLIRRAIKKYGSNNFIKEVLYTFDSEKEMNIKEKELVNHNDSLCYNLNEGGHGGWAFVHKNGLHKLPSPLKGKKTGPLSAERKKNMSVSKIGSKNPMYGRNHTDETKAQMSIVRKGRKLGPQSPIHIQKRIAAAIQTRCGGKN
jgi:group I intron endonuclease